MKCAELEAAAARLILGLASTRDVPELAADALAAGCDSPALRDLAGAADRGTDDVGLLLDLALDELGVPRIDERWAVMLLARRASAELVEGTTSAYEAATRIWEITLRAREHHPDLDTFVYAASEWSDRPDDREMLTAGVLAAARELTSA